MIQRLFFALFVLLSLSNLQAQDAIIYDIKVEGTKKSKVSFIKKILASKKRRTLRLFETSKEILLD